MSDGRSVIMDAAGLERALDGLAAEILEGGGDLSRLAVIGIRRRGVPIAERLAGKIAKLAGAPEGPKLGALDITLYRDDLSLVAEQPLVRRTEIDFPIDGLRVVLTDDVLFTARTVRAAIDAVFALGRPAKIELAVLIDRGWRELPIEANYVAKRLETTKTQRVHVQLQEVDGQDGVELVEVSA